MKPKILAVVGPTASGKSALAVALAGELGGEIVSCDSMQIYRGMDIGTAKPDKAEMCGIRHHMIDIVSPEESFSCADYSRLARLAVHQVLARDALPVFCGGTGLYLDAVLRGGFAPDVSPCIRDELQRRTTEELYRELSEADPASAAAIHPNNRKRVIRALEIYCGTGKTKTEWDRLSADAERPFDALLIGLDYRKREILYERIDRRVDEMLQRGLVEEVKRLALRRNSTAAQAIGYKELYEWLDGGCSKQDAVSALKQNTRNYAKRQLTWFRRNPEVHWLYPDDYAEEERFACVLREASALSSHFLAG